MVERMNSRNRINKNGDGNERHDEQDRRDDRRVSIGVKDWGEATAELAGETPALPGAEY